MNLEEVFAEMPDETNGQRLFCAVMNDDGTYGEPFDASESQELVADIVDPSFVLPDLVDGSISLEFRLPWYRHSAWSNAFTSHPIYTVRSIKRHGKSHKGKERRCR